MRAQAGRGAAFACLAGTALSLGCVSTGNLGLVARPGADPGALLAEPHGYRELGPVEAKACRYFVLAILPFGNSAVSTAIENALAQSGGDVLVNVTNTTSLYGFAPIYNVSSFTCTTVQGTASQSSRRRPGPETAAIASDQVRFGAASL